MIQGAASAASLTRPVSQSRTDVVQQDTQQQQERQVDVPPSGSDSVEISSQQASSSGAGSAGGSAFETAQQVLEAKTQMVGESLDAQKQTLDLLA